MTMPLGQDSTASRNMSCASFSVDTSRAMIDDPSRRPEREMIGDPSMTTLMRRPSLAMRTVSKFTMRSRRRIFSRLPMASLRLSSGMMSESGFPIASPRNGRTAARRPGSRP
jgi:hypothetical protein